MRAERKSCLALFYGCPHEARQDFLSALIYVTATYSINIYRDNINIKHKKERTGFYFSFGSMLEVLVSYFV